MMEVAEVKWITFAPRRECEYVKRRRCAEDIDQIHARLPNVIGDDWRRRRWQFVMDYNAILRMDPITEAELQRWVSIRESPTLLRLLGGEGRVKGLFAERTFMEGQYIGRYVGKILMPEEIEEFSYTEAGDALIRVEFGHNTFYIDGRQPTQTNEEQKHLFGCIFIDNNKTPYPGMSAHLINDCRGTHHPPNVQIFHDGWIRALYDIPVNTELFYSYGSSYWGFGSGSSSSEEY